MADWLENQQHYSHLIAKMLGERAHKRFSTDVITPAWSG
eukprot:CAMPEP_0177558784 /NCGR_PEP_ID=MMETSP0369-20130122/70462_1 /TAXON_ID=447022 ORGANISM="Scrippsiella hangoei-like, Strain SHHI-4" /NCGR_SAMPLE_ID=MMETSP0369 /ASSEMBLY_ACC=CAM_ASM_000364 /LENGTH=38 /DNA_ID= /DNA_START= /DNA_END= /DNA_ORIENTATION=